MTTEETALLLTVARLLRAHMNDHMNHPEFSYIDEDWVALNDALKPFDPTPTESGIGGEKLAPMAELDPHAYVPSAAHMGDCAICGHLQGAAIHSPARRT